MGRCCCSALGGHVLVKINALESARFGVVAAHVRSPHASQHSINAAAETLGVQMLTLRSDCADHALIHAAEADSFRLMDTIVYYERSLEEPRVEVSEAMVVAIRQAGPGDAAAVADIARAAFSKYVGHYHADPRLDSASADAAYVDWAQRSVTDQSDEERARLLHYDGSPAGFLTLRRNNPAEFEIVLNAVHPDFQRRGLYERLLRDALVASHEEGAQRTIVSTQLNNFRVQRVWSKLGFRLASAHHTFHKWYF